MKLKIKTLTPVHISTGINLEPFDYLTKDNDVYRISLPKAIEVISAEVPDAPERFAEWLDFNLFRFDKQQNTAHFQANKQQSKIRKEINFGVFCRNELKRSDLVDKLLKSAAIYKMPLPFGMSNNTQINEQIKSPDNLPYIPGTSIKGAVRTALAANAWLKLSESERARITRNTKEQMRSFKASKYYDMKEEELMKLLFSCQTAGSVKFDAARFSILRFFHFSDAHLAPADQPEPMQTNPVYLYLKDKEPQPQTNTQEMIAPGVIFEFDLTIDTAGLSKAFKESKKGSGLWLDLEMKLERLLDVKLSDIPGETLEKALVEAILKILNKHADNTFKRDLKWFDGLSYFSKKNGIAEATINRIKKFHANGVPSEGGTLKTGWGSGFLSTTIFHSVKQTDEPFLTEMFKDMKLGEPRGGNKVTSPPNLNYFPKSRRMSAEQLLIPDSVLGWIQIAENLSVSAPVSSETVGTESSTKVEAAVPQDNEAFIVEYTAANQKLKLKDSQKMYARVLRSEAPMIVCEIFHPNLPGEFKARYPAGLPDGSFVILNVNFIKSGQIQNVTLAKALV